MTNPNPSGAIDHEAIRRHRWRLAVPLLVALALLGGYTLVWFQGARVMRAEIDAWVAAEQAEGRRVEHGRVRVRGYPGSLRAEVDAPLWADPGAWAWQGETLYVITEPLNPRRLLLTPRGPQTIERDGRTYRLLAGDLRVSLEAGRVGVEAADLQVTSGEQAVTLGAARVSWTEAETDAEAGAGAGAATLGLSLGQLSVSDGKQDWYVPQLNAALSEGPASDLGLDAFEGALSPARGERAAVLGGQGRVDVVDGYPAGQLTVTVPDPEALAAVLAEGGVLDPQQAGTASLLAAGFSDETGAASVPLTMRDGRLRVGPVPVADLPRLGS